jgi:hypothetical protein
MRTCFLSLQKKCDGGFLSVVEWRSGLPYRKMCSFRKGETARRGLSGSRSMTVVENLPQTAARHWIEAGPVQKAQPPTRVS